MTNATNSNHFLLNKKQLRLQCRQARNSLTAEQQIQHAQVVKQSLMNLSIFHSSDLLIGVTLAFDGEVDLMPSMQALKDQHQLYLPRLKPDTTLDFLPWQEQVEMQANVLGIPEPMGEQVIGIADLDVVLMPLVGVDKQGNRLGMGAGYYDKSLAQASQRPYLIGVAHQCQQVESLPVDDWDIPLDALVTEQGLTVWRAYQSKHKELS